MRRHEMVSINSIPRELLTYILTLIAASSSTDFFNAKIRAFFDAADDVSIYRWVSLKTINSFSWGNKVREKTVAFLLTCKICENPEALYRQGVIECFGNNLARKTIYLHWNMRLDYSLKDQVNSGLHCLKIAAISGHLEASYVLAIVFLGSKDKELQQQGKTLLTKTKGRQRECRKQLESLLRHIEWNFGLNYSLINDQPVYCEKRNTHKKNQSWGNESDEEFDLQCENCTWDNALSSFWRMMRRA